MNQGAVSFMCCLSPIGDLTLVADPAALMAVRWPADRLPHAKPLEGREDPHHPVLQQTRDQLAEYFSGRRISFDIPIRYSGTVFQNTVWQTLTRIGYGQTWSYAALAEQIGAPKASRAVGMANSRNPIPIIVPCHRVIGKNGRLTGFTGGLDIKAFLLDLEQKRHECS